METGTLHYLFTRKKPTPTFKVC